MKIDYFRSGFLLLFPSFRTDFPMGFHSFVLEQSPQGKLPISFSEEPPEEPWPWNRHVFVQQWRDERTVFFQRETGDYYYICNISSCPFFCSLCGVLANVERCAQMKHEPSQFLFKNFDAQRFLRVLVSDDSIRLIKYGLCMLMFTYYCSQMCSHEKNLQCASSSRSSALEVIISLWVFRSRITRNYWDSTEMMIEG